MVQEEFSEAARVKPWEAAGVSQAPEGEAPITIETVHPRNADSVAVPAIDLTGYRTSSQTCPSSFIIESLNVTPRQASERRG